MKFKMICIILIISAIILSGCIQYVPDDQLPATRSVPVENKTNVTVKQTVAHAAPTLQKPSIYGFVPPI